MVMRIGGLASGIDTDSIVSDMMKVARLPLDKLTKQQQTLEWKRDDYRAINTSLLTFRNELSNMKYTNKYRVRSVESTDASKVTATATNVANVGSSMIANVEKLATPEVIIGNKIKKAGLEESVVPKSSGSLFEQIGVTKEELTFKLTVLGQEKEFTVKKDMSMNDVLNAVNSAGIGVNMFYDSATGKVSLSRTESGMLDNDGEIILQAFAEDNDGKEIYPLEIENYQRQIDGSGEFLKLIGLGSDDDRAVNLKAPTQKAQNAVLTINGIETQRHSNTFTENGITFNLKQTFEGSVTTTIKNDTDAVYDNIKSFIDNYNKLISSIQDKIGEERNKDYEPLTDEEKEALSETQIEKWEKIAKTGLLRNDTTLSSALSSMRLNFSDTALEENSSSNPFNTLSKIGITTTSDYLAGGKLEINEEKLKAAIEADPDAVEQLFRGDEGVVQKLYDTVTKTMDNIKLKAGNSNSTNQTFTLGREIDGIDDRISSLQDRLEQIENRYWKQFTAMETAIQRANEQYASLSSFFSTGQ